MSSLTQDDVDKDDKTIEISSPNLIKNGNTIVEDINDISLSITTSA